MKTSIGICALGLLAAVPASMAATVVTFASGRASVPLPSSFRVTTQGDDLTATFGKGGKHKLEITLLAVLPSNPQQSDLAAQFVREQAEDKKIESSSSPGRAVLTEPGGDSKFEGTTYRLVHWQVGAANCLFTMTVTAPLPLSSDLNEFLDGPLNDIINNIGCTKP